MVTGVSAEGVMSHSRYFIEVRTLLNLKDPKKRYHPSDKMENFMYDFMNACRQVLTWCVLRYIDLDKPTAKVGSHQYQYFKTMFNYYENTQEYFPAFISQHQLFLLKW